MDGQDELYTDARIHRPEEIGLIEKDKEGNTWESRC